MPFCYIAFVLLMLSLLGGVCGQFSMKVRLSSVTSVEGGQVDITCDVTNRQQEKSFFVLWVKKSDGEEMEIGTNDHINEIFEKTGRYKAKYHLPVKNNFSKVIFVLTIENLTSSDSGDIGCRIPDYVEILRPFTVIVPVTSVRIMSRDMDNTHAIAYEDGQNVTFVEGQSARFFCHVNGSYPQPEVKITVGRRDVTRLFDETAELVRDGPKGLQVFYYKVELVNLALEMEYEYSRQVMTCSARDPDHVLPAKSAFIYIHLTGYRPKFLCSHQYATKLYEGDVNISCAIVSDPPLDSARVHWKRLSDDHDEVLSSGEQDGHYAVTLRSGATIYQKQLSLLIKKAYPQTFRLYTFEADNKLGTSSHGIDLMEQGPPQRLRSVSSRLKRHLSLIGSMLVLSLFSFGFHVIP